MGLFDRFNKKKVYIQKRPANTEELFGQAWLMIIGGKEKAEGLRTMAFLQGLWVEEANIVLAMFAEDAISRKNYLERTAESGHPEALWQYCNLIPHSYVPDPKIDEDRKWEECCLKAAENGSPDAMNEMGNIFNRRNNYHEAMYWYALANANGHPSGEIGMQGITVRWLSAGMPEQFIKGSPQFDEARFKCAQAYLEINAGQQISLGVEEAVDMVLDGVSIAGYLAGDIFESIENYEMATKIYSMLAQHNDAHGTKCYGDMLLSGMGGIKDPETAFSMYKKAAELGDRSAMFIMGEFYKDSNILMAAYWYGLAHSRGYEHAITRLQQLEQL